jgi:hypothetical protein
MKLLETAWAETGDWTELWKTSSSAVAGAIEDRRKLPAVASALQKTDQPKTRQHRNEAD